jgi:AraC family transcriptional regulator
MFERVEERVWTCRIDEPMRFAVLATSQCWSGIEAKIYRTSGGFSQSSPHPYHSITMHVSSPIHSRCSLDGSVAARLQAPGDIDLLPAGTYAAWEDDGETTMLGVSLQPTLIANAAQAMGVNPDRISIEPHMQLRDPRIEHIGWALKAELEATDSLGRVYAESLGTALASHLLQRYARPQWTHAHFSKRRLRPVIDYIHEHLTQELSLFELAEIAGMSPTHLKVLFKRTFGLPVHQYIIRRRVEYAVKLIAETRLPLSDVAIAAGFSDQSHMTRFTRRIIGASPSEFRDRA